MFCLLLFVKCRCALGLLEAAQLQDCLGLWLTCELGYLVHLLCPQDIWAEREGLWSHTLWITATLYRENGTLKMKRKSSSTSLNLLWIYLITNLLSKNILICSPKNKLFKKNYCKHSSIFINFIAFPGISISEEFGGHSK